MSTHFIEEYILVCLELEAYYHGFRGPLLGQHAQHLRYLRTPIKFSKQPFECAQRPRGVTLSPSTHSNVRTGPEGSPSHPQQTEIKRPIFALNLVFILISARRGGLVIIIDESC